jgi:ribosomal protein S14
LPPCSSSRNCRAILGHSHPQSLRDNGRPRGYYRKHKLSRIALRDLGSKGMIPGLLKSSW